MQYIFVRPLLKVEPEVREILIWIMHLGFTEDSIPACSGILVEGKATYFKYNILNIKILLQTAVVPSMSCHRALEYYVLFCTIMYIIFTSLCKNFVKLT
jgi:hypothetical protein